MSVRRYREPRVSDSHIHPRITGFAESADLPLPCCRRISSEEFPSSPHSPSAHGGVGIYDNHLSPNPWKGHFSPRWTRSTTGIPIERDVGRSETNTSIYSHRETLLSYSGYNRSICEFWSLPMASPEVDRQVWATVMEQPSYAVEILVGQGGSRYCTVHVSESLEHAERGTSYQNVVLRNSLQASKRRGRILSIPLPVRMLAIARHFR